jgi:hypothetical protein
MVSPYPNSEHVVEISKPRPADRPDVDIEYRTLKAEEWGGDHDILIKIHYEDDMLPEDVTTLGGLPITTPTRTILDLAAYRTDADMAEIVETAIDRGHTTVDELHKAIARHPRHKGGGQLTSLL